MLKVSNFSSVLEIAFAGNFLFFFFELRPLIEHGWRGIRRRFSRVKLDVFGKDFDRFVRFSSLEIVQIGLELFGMIITFYNSALSLGLLMQSGYDPDFQVSCNKMTEYLCVFFIPVPALWLISIAYLSFVQGKLDRLEADKRVENQKGKTAP